MPGVECHVVSCITEALRQRLLAEAFAAGVCPAAGGLSAACPSPTLLALWRWEPGHPAGLGMGCMLQLLWMEKPSEPRPRPSLFCSVPYRAPWPLTQSKAYCLLLSSK